MSMPNVLPRPPFPTPPVQHQALAPSAAPDSEPMALALSVESGREPAAVAPAQAVWGAPTAAPVARSDMNAARLATEAADDARAARGKDWRLADIMCALGTSSAAELLIEKADRPGPVEPGSLVEAIKMFRGLIPAPRQHPDLIC